MGFGCRGTLLTIVINKLVAKQPSRRRALRFPPFTHPSPPNNRWSPHRISNIRQNSLPNTEPRTAPQPLHFLILINLALSQPSPLTCSQHHKLVPLYPNIRLHHQGFFDAQLRCSPSPTHSSAHSSRQDTDVHAAPVFSLCHLPRPEQRWVWDLVLETLEMYGSS
jgi:hypothetical protein